LHIRVPQELHEQLRAMAEEQGVSVNGLVLTLLAGATGVDVTHADPDAAEWG
jgi:predicted HicB family RNase H-like nuclease